MKKKSSAFYAPKQRGPYAGIKRTPFHVLLTPEERKKLAVLSVRLKLTAADVVRSLISKAKAGTS